jgi:molybdopterin synthase catalytic subunit
LQALIYEAYEPMAIRVLTDLADQAAARWGCRLIRVHHAVGEVGIGSASVLVQTMTPHRTEAFESCRFLIDSLKVQTPIWKRERWTSGTTWTVGHPAQAQECC